MNEKKVLALYDFASKQEFIYRTSKIKEISGASEMLSSIYGELVSYLNNLEDGVKINSYDPDTEVDSFNLNAFETSVLDAQVLYEGGGNLMVLYKNKTAYIKANRLMSVYLLEKCPTLSMIACCVPFESNFDANRKALYKENAIAKKRRPSAYISGVTPFTMVDPLTFFPVTYRKSYPEQSLSADRAAKQACYKKKSTDNLEGLEGLAAVIYIDGNSMGDKLKKCSSEDYDEGVRKLRTFSKQVNDAFVVKPLKAIEEILGDNSKGYRRVIGGGDEITIICEAKDAWNVVKKYFEVLSVQELSLIGCKCTSCAGISVFHAKAPFDTAYQIAQAACESAKRHSRSCEDENNNNYIDFHYCHSGITNDFKTLRETEQKHATGRPYHFDDIKSMFDYMTPILQAADRANVKALGNAAQKGFTDYLLEVERVNAYLAGGVAKLNCSEQEMKLVYDMAEFYDIWFAKDGECNEETT